MRRWPNTRHWKNLVSACRHTSGSAWRTTAAALLGCDKCELRARVDHNMHPDRVRKIYKLLADHLDSYADDLRRRADEAGYAAGYLTREARFAAAADFDANQWMMRQRYPPVSDLVRENINAAINAILEEA
ncbi:MAG TPA: hypothetical protein VF499_12640 [Afipia sp.]